ncbi:MAG: cob(I)yrinic acid a,c-diamide adenosyltransferase [Deltaproteobacteria bacterium]|nr:cob(I)yrinic acid a,c-diamide adenosyltransferase [Deltaproteobacteria bacterium]
MNIVTKKGDFGTTGLASGKRVSKADARIEAVGTLDELVSFLGLARASCADKPVAGHLKNIQQSLFALGTEIADGGLLIKEEHLQAIEALINEYQPKLKEQKGFIIPGENQQSAFIDAARTVCRRLERRVVELKEAGTLKNETAFKFINRLSDLLYIFARSI